MDRVSRAEVGGPYASHDDAMRAIQNKGFDSDPTELTVQEGSSDDDDEGSSKESSLKQAKFPPPADSGGGATMKPAPEDPLKSSKDTAKDAAPVPAETDDADAAPDDTADPTAPDNGSSLPEPPEAAGAPVDPLGDPATQVTTTKPAQVPSGGGGGMPGMPGESEIPGMPDDTEDAVGSEEDVAVDPPGLETATDKPSSDPVGGAIDAVTAQILQSNPHLPHHLVRRVARTIVGKMVEANALMPHIEDPLADKNPLSLVHDVKKTLPKGSPAAAPTHEDDGGDDDSSLPGPMAPGFQRDADGRLLGASPEAGAGAAAAGEGAAGAEGAAGLLGTLGEAAPLLLL